MKAPTKLAPHHASDELGQVTAVIAKRDAAIDHFDVLCALAEQLIGCEQIACEVHGEDVYFVERMPEDVAA